MSSLVQPHGGTLIDRLVSTGESDAFRAAAHALPSLVLDARELADLELIGTGAIRLPKRAPSTGRRNERIRASRIWFRDPRISSRAKCMPCCRPTRPSRATG